MNIDEAWRRQFTERSLARLAQLRPIDDVFMRCMFRGDLSFAQFVLRIILDKDDLVLTGAETQRDMKRLAGARSITLDVHATDSEHRQYDIEVQRADEGAEPERARYHSAAMDIEALSAGQPFKALPETYVIFITEHDVFRAGKGLYPVERINLGTGAPFDDREHILYVNGQYRGDDALGKLMHDFLCSDPGDMLYEEMAERSGYYKDDPKGALEMCKIMEDIYQEGRAEGREEGWTEGREEGRAEGRLNSLFDTIRKLRLTTGWSDEEIVDKLSISSEDWKLFLASN